MSRYPRSGILRVAPENEEHPEGVAWWHHTEFGYAQNHRAAKSRLEAAATREVLATQARCRFIDDNRARLAATDAGGVGRDGC